MDLLIMQFFKMFQVHFSRCDDECSSLLVWRSHLPFCAVFYFTIYVEFLVLKIYLMMKFPLQ
jgi:hypothetical protein